MGRDERPAFSFKRAACDFLATLVFDRVFERFPNLRVASVENGSEFLADVFRNLVVELMGADRVIFGSDWPHMESMPEPLGYLSELDDFDTPTRRKILRHPDRC